MTALALLSAIQTTMLDAFDATVLVLALALRGER